MKKTQVAVYLLAYNEEENIENVIRAVFKQKANTIFVSSVVVFADGSTDKTVQIVKKLKSEFSKLELRQFTENMGKYFRLNQIFKANSADILVILDSDIAIVGNTFLENLTGPIMHSVNTMVSAAHSTLVMPKSILGKLVASCFLTWDYIRLSIPNYDSVHNFSSQATAYRGSFAKKLSIPKTAFEERIYIYLMAKKENKNGFVYAKTAEIKFLPPASIEDLELMTERPFGKKQEDIDKLFGFDTESLLTVPMFTKIKGLCLSFIHHPFLTPSGLLLNFIIPKLSLAHKTTSIKWKRSNSTKEGIK